MTFAAGLLARLDKIRGIPDALGLRPYTVAIVVSVTAGGNPYTGESSVSITETDLFLANGRKPRVEQISAGDVSSSGGLYQLQDLRVGPFTPAYTAGGFSPSDLDPEHTGATITFRVTGPGVSGLYKRVSNEFDSSLTYSIVLRKLGAP